MNYKIFFLTRVANCGKGLTEYRIKKREREGSQFLGGSVTLREPEFPHPAIPNTCHGVWQRIPKQGQCTDIR
jgi:hypothetical protein